jgi:hypothetical protein
MNEERFIEQLNAYIDRELSGAEIREIEAAISASPERQQIYHQYCKIERGCQALLAAEVKAPRPSIAAIISAANTSEGENVTPFTSTQGDRSRTAGLSWGTAFAGLAAACVAGIIYISGPQSEKGGVDSIATQMPVPAVTIGLDDSSTNLSNASYRTVFTTRDTAPTTPARFERSTPDSFAWMNQLEFAPIRPVSIDTLQFKTAEPMQVRTLSAYAYPYPGLDDTPPLSETAAFQFQR